MLENTGNYLLKIKHYVKKSNYWHIPVASSVGFVPAERRSDMLWNSY